MPAMDFAAMGRSYRYPQVDRQVCLQFAARQGGVVDGAAAPTNQAMWRRFGSTK